MIQVQARTTMALIGLAALTGCVGGLLGGGKPAQLYRLENSSAVPAESPAAGSIVAAPAALEVILLPPPRFDPAIEGDWLLASQGRKSSHIANARWASPVPVLFEQALRRAVAQIHPSITFADRRDGLVSDRALQITIDHFEADYATAQAAPTIVIQGEATLVDLKSRRPIARYAIEASKAAQANDIAAIVGAFGAATDDAVVHLAQQLPSS